MNNMTCFPYLFNTISSPLNFHQNFIISLFSPVLVVLCEGSSGASSTTLISVDLIHRDYSVQSLFFDPSYTDLERFRACIKRSLTRSRSIQSSIFSAVSPVPPYMNNTTNVTSIVFPDDNEYLMKLAIGTPPHELFAVADTGSDLIWIQCKPWNVCFKQKSSIFNPDNSSTYKDLSCSSQPCQSLNLSGGLRPCEGDHRRCPYFDSYADGSAIAGFLARETFTLDSTNGTPIAFPQVSFGCGHDNKGFHEENWSVIVGLGRGSLSLINQLGPSISRRFSYCLVPQYSNSSYTSGSEAANYILLVEDIDLPPMNTFIAIQSLNGEVILCFAFVPPIYENVALMDFLVEYDLENRNIKFKKTICMNHV